MSVHSVTRVTLGEFVFLLFTAHFYIAYHYNSQLDYK